MSINYTLALLQAAEIEILASERFMKWISFGAWISGLILIGYVWGFAALLVGMMLTTGATFWGIALGREMIREESAETLKALNEKL